MEKKRGYSVLDKKIENLESKINPIISGSRKPETTTPYDFVPEEIKKEFNFINKILTAEIASNSNPGLGPDDTHHLERVAHRVMAIQSVLNKWQLATSFTVSGDQPATSFTVSGDEEVHKPDHEHEEDEGFRTAGFKVYENSLFDDDCDQENRLMDFEEIHDKDDDDDDEGYTEKPVENAENFIPVMEMVKDDEDEDEEDTEKQVENVENFIPVKEMVKDDDEEDDAEKPVENAEKFEGIRAEVEKFRVIDQKEKKRKKAKKVYDDEDDDYETNNPHCCFRLVFWVGLMGLGMISLMAGFSDFPDYYSPDMIFNPT
ncbi:hypothetical protein SOVF_076280 [Spinacia oleracea]|nr:hypothetical protein SOVF_076280 [Spinacia oleracea]